MASSQLDLFNANEEIINNEDFNIVPRLYKKYINFHKILFEPCFLDKSKSESDILSETINGIFKDRQNVSVGDVFIQPLEVNADYFFGCLHKISEPDILTAIKKTIDGSNVDMDELIFESITFFYIDFSTLGLAVIKTQRIQSSTEYLVRLIEENSLLHINVVPFKKSDTEIKNIIATGMNVSFYNADKNFISIEDLKSDDCEIDSLQLKIKFKKTTNSFVKNLIDKYKKNNTVKKLSISTNTEDIDILKNTFTRQVSISLTKDFMKDLDSIMRSLRDELLKIINT